MKEALITGSEGFAGQHLWKELKDHGYSVSGTTLAIPESGLSENVYQCDVLDEISLQKLLATLKPEIIFHLAAQTNPGLSFRKPQLTVEINTIGTINLLEAVRANPALHPRIIIIGSSSEYGPVRPGNLPITEEHPLDPIDPYATSKVASWFIARQYVRSFGLDIVYVTPFNHTGPGQALGFLAPDTASQIAAIEKQQSPGVITTGDLSSSRDYCDVRDVVRAYRLLIDKGVSGERYIVSSGHSVSSQEIVDTLIGLSSSRINKSVDPKRNRPSDIKDSFGSHQKITQATGWEPRIPLEQTLSDLLDWYRSKA